jgi:N4-gp56 family major capsid protein
MAIAGTTTQQSGQLHLATVYYNRVGLDTLVPKFRFYQACEKFSQPQGNGKTMQMWRDTVPGYNTTPASEGVTLSTPFVNPTSTLSVTVEPYSDFMSTSTMIEDTSIANEGERMVRALSIRAAGSVDSIIRAEVDSNSGTTVTIATIGSNMAAADIKKGVRLLEGLNVEPFDGTRWLCILHPYVVYDIAADTTAGGFIDSLKYQSGRQVLNGEVGEIGGARLLTTTNVNTSDSGATTKYHAYLFGYQGVGVAELSGRGPDGVVDPKRQNFKINMYKGGGPWDPTGEIGSVAGYRFVFAAKTLDSQRFLIFKADSSIA